MARRPAIPRKAFGAVLTGLALGVGGMMGQSGFVYPVLFGVIGAILHLGAFGMDPMKNKGMEGIDDFQSDRVARAIDEAEGYLRGMKDATLRANDRKVEARVDTFAAAARAMFRGVENDPRDLTAARKYLSVYLMGARDAAVKFADLYAQTRDPQALSDFDALLTDLETHFAARTQTLLSDNRTDLDVEISVLRERLQRET
jgi:5-bromo-4-chloroindolyl phosphate hydrolysis protein